MKKNPLVSVFVLLVVFASGCNYLKNVSLLLEGEMDRSNFVQEIPFEYRKGLIVIQATINQDTTVREFIFDTGAFNSKIEKSLAESLGLKTIAKKDNSTAQGKSQPIEVTRIDSLKIGETMFRNIGAGKLEYAPESASRCIAKDGLIGANLIKLAHWKIDYIHQKIYFSDKPFEKPAGPSHVLAFDRPTLSGTPFVDISLGGRTVEGIMFDSGFNGGLTLPMAVEDAFKAPSRMFIDRSTTGIYGTNTDTLIEKSIELKLAGVVSNIPVAFSSLGKGLLGNEVLEHFIVIIDNQENEIILEHIDSVQVPMGLTFIPGIQNDSTWIVDRIATGHRALKLGDSLRTINGKMPSDLFEDYCDYFMGVRSLIDQTDLQVVTHRLDTMIFNSSNVRGYSQ